MTSLQFWRLRRRDHGWVGRPDTDAGTGWSAWLMILVSLLMGVLVSFSSALVLAIPLALIAGGLLTFSPTVRFLELLVFCSMLVIGPGLYFAGIEAMRWLLVAATALLCLNHYLKSLVSADPIRARGFGIPAWLLPGMIFLVLVTVSSMLGAGKVGAAISAVKFYLVMFPLVIVARSLASQLHFWNRTWLFYIGVAMFQLPVAIYQYKFYAAKKVRSAEWDAVVGTFPGNAEGGGASAAMGVFMIMALVMTLALWRAGVIKRWVVGLVFVFSLGAIMMAEVKAVALLMPVAAALVFRKQILQRPGKAILALVIGVLLTLGLLTFYSHIQYADAAASLAHNTAPKSPFEAIANQFDADRQSRFTGEPSRLASLRIWWDSNVGARDWLHSLLGYGAGATQVSRFGIGELVQRYPFKLDQTSSTLLLWETGLLGHGAVVLALLVVIRRANRLAGHAALSQEQREVMYGVGVCLTLFLLTLPYKSFLFVTAPSQLFFALLVAYVWSTERDLKDGALALQRPERHLIDGIGTT